MYYCHYYNVWTQELLHKIYKIRRYTLNSLMYVHGQDIQDIQDIIIMSNDISTCVHDHTSLTDSL